MWSVGTILNGLLSFMYENNITTGSISSSKAEKKRLAVISLEQNLRNPTFRKLFPEWVQEHQRREQAAQVWTLRSQEKQMLVNESAFLLTTGMSVQLKSSCLCCVAGERSCQPVTSCCKSICISSNGQAAHSGVHADYIGHTSGCLWSPAGTSDVKMI